jgi:serine/threonine protein kinase
MTSYMQSVFSAAGNAAGSAAGSAGRAAGRAYSTASDYVNKPKLADFTKGERIGSGASGVVFKCMRNIDQKEFAWKEMIVTEIGGKGTKILTNKPTLERETVQLKKLVNGKNVLKYIFSTLIDKTAKKDAYFILITELVIGIDLERLIYSDIVITEEGKKWIIAQLFSALSSLQDAGVIHFDIKPSNVMITADYSVVLIDFGSSWPIDNGTQGHVVNSTLNYTNDDMLVFKPPDKKGEVKREKYVKTTTDLMNYDIWCVGCIMFELYNRNFLFKSLSEVDHKKKLLAFNNEPKRYFDDNGAEEFFKYFMRTEGKQMPPHIMQHKWIKDYIDYNNSADNIEDEGTKEEDKGGLDLD